MMRGDFTYVFLPAEIENQVFFMKPLFSRNILKIIT